MPNIYDNRVPVTVAQLRDFLSQYPGDTSLLVVRLILGEGVPSTQEPPEEESAPEREIDWVKVALTAAIVFTAVDRVRSAIKRKKGS